MDFFMTFRKKQHKHADSEHAPSVSEVSFTSTRSSRYGMRDPTAEAKPVTDPLLRSKLKTARSPGAKVTSRVGLHLHLILYPLQNSMGPH